MDVTSVGLALGEWAAPKQLYGAIVMVSAFTCILASLVV